MSDGDQCPVDREAEAKVGCDKMSFLGRLNEKWSYSLAGYHGNSTLA